MKEAYYRANNALQAVMDESITLKNSEYLDCLNQLEKNLEERKSKILAGELPDWIEQSKMEGIR
ncbi:MAG: hypothetical protein LBJ83_02125 [Oscillospiraceae bacterium]|jgi:hypothetical protein|nr:hypothetical protein [Oscillospiraceae bacterium]